MVKTQVWFKQGTQSEKTKKYPLVDGIIKRNAEETPDGKRRWMSEHFDMFVWPITTQSQTISIFYIFGINLIFI